MPELSSVSKHIFDFLQATFKMMPRPVQVIGWLIFLLLFTVIVLHPILGLTIFKGQIITLTRDDITGKKIGPKFEEGIEVTHDGKTIKTNESGEFTYVLKGGAIPFVGVQFKLGPNYEIVNLSSALPYVSAFHPNITDIYYVPGSKYQNSLGPKYYFTDKIEASKAFDDAEKASTVTGNDIGSLTIAGFDLNPIQNVIANSDIGKGVNPSILRFSSIRMKEIREPVKANVKMKILYSVYNKEKSKEESKSFFFIPNIEQPLENFDLKFKGFPKSINIKIYEKKYFYKKKIEEFNLGISPDEISKPIKYSSNSLIANFQLFPPIDIDYIVIDNTMGKSKTVYYWLSVSEENLRLINKVSYQKSNRSKNRIVTSPIIDDFDYYSFGSTTYDPFTVTATIEFNSGGKIKLRKALYFNVDKPNDFMDYYMLARHYMNEREYNKSFEFIKKSLEINQDFIPAKLVKAAHFSNGDQLKGGMAIYDDVLEETMNNNSHYIPYVQSSYSRYLVKMDNILTRPQIEKVKNLANNALAVDKENIVALSSLAWSEYLLGNNESALDKINKAIDIIEAQLKTSSIASEFYFKRGKILFALKRNKLAESDYKKVIEQVEKYNYDSSEINRYVEMAENELRGFE